MNKIFKRIVIIVVIVIALSVAFDILRYGSIFSSFPVNIRLRGIARFPLGFLIVFGYLLYRTVKSLINKSGEDESARRERELDIIASVKENDILFDENDFAAYAVSAMTAVQRSITERDVSLAEPYISASYEKALRASVTAHRKKKRTMHYEKAEMCGVSYIDYYISDGTEYLTLNIAARLLEYMTDDISGGVISGTAEQTIERLYKLTFTKACGEVDVDMTQCPRCGASLDGAAGKCEYCDTVFHTDECNRLISSYGIAKKV